MNCHQQTVRLSTVYWNPAYETYAHIMVLLLYVVWIHTVATKYVSMHVCLNVLYKILCTKSIVCVLSLPKIDEFDCIHEWIQQMEIHKIHDSKKTPTHRWRCLVGWKSLANTCIRHVRVAPCACVYVWHHLRKISSSFSTKLYSKLLIPLRLALTTVL